MTSYDAILKAVFNNLFYTVAIVVGLCFLGSIISAGLLVFQWDLVSAVLFEKGSHYEYNSGIAILVSTVVFPLLYLYYGSNLAVEFLLMRILRSNKYDLIFWLMSAIKESKPELFGKGGEIHTTSAELIACTTKIQTKMPLFLGRTIKYLINKIGLSQKITTAIQAQAAYDHEKTDSCSVESISKSISGIVSDNLVKPNLKQVLSVIVIHCLLFFL